MRKSIFLTLVLSLCMADFGAFAANARGGRTSTPAANNTAAAAPVAARAGARQTVKASPTAAAAQPSAAVSGNTAARAGKKQTVKSAPAASSASPASGQPMAARAGATQKVIQTGSKVATAATNTAVPQECQDAFFGCMDSFCMLDNVSGGRCQCSDRITTLDKVLEEILKLDERTYVMATEGVERIQMGEAADQIMARAKAAAEGVSVKDGVAIGGSSQSASASRQKITTKQLDLSAWSKSIYDDDDDDGDVFGEIIKPSDDVASFADKKGDELYTSAAKMCIKMVPDQCKQYNSMVQLVYAQKIKSDCSAYENSLKQQRSASQQKLLAAEKALRDAALDEYNDQNKYGDAGSCAMAFAQCMQNEAGCGSDYTGCVTLSAKDNVKGGAKQTKIEGVVSGADITLAASTMEALLAKKEICQKVVKQCINANKNDAVWTIFLRNAAPALKSAEETAEQRLRMSCIPTVADCFKEACKSTIDPNDPDGSYDMCLSNPATYKSLCKVQLEPCLAATGGSFAEPEKSSLWNGLLAALAAMKVDACTKEITTCLTDRCEEDFSGCVGLSTEAIIGICPTDKLTACQEENGHGPEAEETIRKYVISIAQGLELKMNNSMLAACQKNVNTAMTNACGDTSSCVGATVPEKTIADMFSAKVCKINGTDCKGTADAFSNTDALAGLIVKIEGPDLSKIDYRSVVGEKQGTVKEIVESAFFGCMDNNGTLNTNNCSTDDSTKTLADLINQTWKTKVSQIITDPKVSMCIDGNDIFDKAAGEDGSPKVTKSKGFSNLTQSAQMIVANGLMENVRKIYDNAMDSITQNEVPGLVAQIKARIEKAAAEEKAKQEAENAMLENVCKSFESFSESKPSVHGCRTKYYTYSSTYNKTTQTCSVRKHKYGRRGCNCGAACPFKNDPEQSSKEHIFNKSDLEKGAARFDMD